MGPPKLFLTPAKGGGAPPDASGCSHVADPAWLTAFAVNHKIPQEATVLKKKTSHTMKSYHHTIVLYIRENYDDDDRIES
eukprot:COSAG01_NODE_497_length_16267_cov_5.357558_16_plen_80_part_00